MLSDKELTDLAISFGWQIKIDDPFFEEPLKEYISPDNKTYSHPAYDKKDDFLAGGWGSVNPPHPIPAEIKLAIFIDLLPRIQQENILIVEALLIVNEQLFGPTYKPHPDDFVAEKINTALHQYNKRIQK